MRRAARFDRVRHARSRVTLRAERKAEALHGHVRHGPARSRVTQGPRNPLRRVRGLYVLLECGHYVRHDDVAGAAAAGDVVTLPQFRRCVTCGGTCP